MDAPQLLGAAKMNLEISQMKKPGCEECSTHGVTFVKVLNMDYRHPKAKSLDLCGHNLNPNHKCINIWYVI